MQSHQQTKRRKKRVLQGPVTKTVTVVRGKFGYGFTISGQNPCVLSCIVAGSPAHVAGLKAGDLLYVVNGQNVSAACHDDVVRMVGLSTGSLELQVAENYNSSDSSDDDYLPRTKSRYPNRVRTNHGLGEKHTKQDRMSSYRATKKNFNESFKQNHSAAEESDLSSSLTSQEDQSWTHLAAVGKARSEMRQDLPLDTEKQRNLSTNSNFCSQPIISTAKQIASAVIKRLPPVTDSVNRRQQDSEDKYGTKPKSEISQTDIQGKNEDSSNQLLKVTENVKAIVGYIGSIETSTSHTHPHQRHQALRNAVRRLRLEKRVYNLLLMEVTPSGVFLTTSLGKQLASYPCERIAFIGICSDDDRFFGLVTQGAPDEDFNNHATGEECFRTANSSCHIFMFQSDKSPHSSHIHQVPSCQIGRSDQFARSSAPLIQCISSLCRDRPSRRFDSDFVQSQAFADPSSQSEHFRCISESGLELAMDEVISDQNEQVCVVDMSSERELLDTSIQAVSVNTTFDNTSPEVSSTAEAAGDVLSSCLNNSTNKDKCLQPVNKLTPQAMPDPACLETGRSEANLPGRSRSTESLKQNMQRYLEARQRMLEEQNCVLASDGESYIGENVVSLSVTEDGHTVLEAGGNAQWQSPEKAFVFTVPTNPPLTSVHNKTRRSAFHLLRSPSAPLSKHSRPETVDLDTANKLSPRAFPHSPPPSSQFHSPSAPLFPHRDSDEDDDNFDSINDAYNCQSWTASDYSSRRFSEGFPAFTRCQMDSFRVPGVHKWSKTGSFRRPDITAMKQSASQSLESLAVGEDANTTSPRLATACSVLNIRERGTVTPDGRVATWAVHFDKLLKDPTGIDTFTKFLKNEFSDENIKFWRACEEFRNLTCDLQRKEQARDIYKRFLVVGSREAINIDDTARQHTEKNLDNPTAVMFDMAQNQIFHLMRQDSYPRFLKSDLYKNMLLKEMEDNTQADHKQNSGKKLGRGQSTGKENSGKRRRSILPWKHQKSVKVASDCDLKKLGKKGTNSNSNNNNNSGTTKRSISMADHGISSTSTANSKNSSTNIKRTAKLGIDLSTMRREVFHQAEAQNREVSQARFCRIIMPDGSSTVVCAKPGQTFLSVLNKLCDKRAVSLSSVDVILLGSDKPLDLNVDISTLGSKEILIERRTVFQLVLPDGKTVEAKAKPNRGVGNVLKPILEKYGYSLDRVNVRLTSCQDILDLEMPVSMLDNKRVVISDPGQAGLQKRRVPLFGLFRSSEKRNTEHKLQCQNDFYSSQDS